MLQLLWQIVRCSSCWVPVYCCTVVQCVCAVVLFGSSVCALLYSMYSMCVYTQLYCVCVPCVCTVVQCCCLLQHLLGLRKRCSHDQEESWTPILINTDMQVYQLQYPVLGHILPADIWMCDCPKEQIKILGKFYFYCCSNFRQSPFWKCSTFRQSRFGRSQQAGSWCCKQVTIKYF